MDSQALYEEIESWGVEKRLTLLFKILERELTHGNHTKPFKDTLYAALFRFRHRAVVQAAESEIEYEPYTAEQHAVVMSSPPFQINIALTEMEYNVLMEGVHLSLDNMEITIALAKTDFERRCLNDSRAATKSLREKLIAAKVAKL